MASSGISSFNYHCITCYKRNNFSCPRIPLSDYMKTLRKLSKKLNDYFIVVILFVFYYPVIGIAFIFYKLFSLNKSKKETYWNIERDSGFTNSDFKSPY